MIEPRAQNGAANPGGLDGLARAVLVAAAAGTAVAVAAVYAYHNDPWRPLAHVLAPWAVLAVAVAFRRPPRLARRGRHRGTARAAPRRGLSAVIGLGIWTPLQRHPEQGAATSVFLAASPLVPGVGGRYFEDCQEAEVVDRLRGTHGVVPHALDPDAARRLWDVSERLVSGARSSD